MDLHNKTKRGGAHLLRLAKQRWSTAARANSAQDLVFTIPPAGRGALATIDAGT
jgi:hypothetical protein